MSSYTDAVKEAPMKQRITIEIEDRDQAGGDVIWRLYGSTGKLITTSEQFGDKMPFATADGALRNAAKATHQLLWIERSC